MNQSVPVVDAILCARMGSSRLPGKTLLPAVGRPMLQLNMERLRRSWRIARLVVATSDRLEDDGITQLCEQLNVPCYRGNACDLLDRVYRCAAHYCMDHIAYFWADNPLIDPTVCDTIVGVYLSDVVWDYVTNCHPLTYPNGQEVEVTSFKLLESVWRQATDPHNREHLLSYLWENSHSFQVRNVAHEPNLHHERWALDFPEDYIFVRRIFEALYPGNPAFGMWDVIRYLDRHPRLRQINATHRSTQLENRVGKDKA